MMLTCAVRARVGGASRFTDGLAVYGDLAAHCPDALAPLSRPRSALFGGAAGYLGSVFTQVPEPGRPGSRYGSAWMIWCPSPLTLRNGFRN